MARRSRKKAPVRRKNNRYRVSPEVKRQRRRRALVSAAIVTGCLSAVLITSSVFVLGYRYLITTPYLRIKSVEVNGCRWLEPDKVKKLTGLHPGQNLMAVNLKKIRKKIEQNPWVAGVVINRVIPDRIVIEITERRPLAMVRLDNNETYLVDTNGYLIVPVSSSDKRSYTNYLVLTRLNHSEVMKKGRIPMEVSEQVKQFISMGEANSSWFKLADIKEMKWSYPGGLTVNFGRPPVVIKLGRGEFSLKFSMLRKVLGEISRRNIGDKIKEIDLRCSPRVYISGKYDNQSKSG